MSLHFCDCNNLVTSVVTSTAKFHMCTVCSKHFPFGEGDTLIRAPAVKPIGFEKNKHIIVHMNKVGLMPITNTKPCPQCKRMISKYAILDNSTWYMCMFDECGHQFQ
jgi:hypothetical protein